MKLKKITDNKIKIFFSTDEFNSKNISPKVLFSNDYITQNLLNTFLEKAKDELNFKVNDEQLVLEAISCTDGFVFTITKILPSLFEYNSMTNIYKIENFENFIDFYKYIKNMKLNFNTNFSLYFYNNNYYLCYLNDSKLNIILKEFATQVKNISRNFWNS